MSLSSPRWVDVGFGEQQFSFLAAKWDFNHSTTRSKHVKCFQQQPRKVGCTRATFGFGAHPPVNRSKRTASGPRLQLLHLHAAAVQGPMLRELLCGLKPAWSHENAMGSEFGFVFCCLGQQKHQHMFACLGLGLVGFGAES